MKFNVYTCEDGTYSKDFERCEIKGRVLITKKWDLEVKLEITPEVEVHAGGKLNVLLRDKDETVDTYDRRYFIKANRWQRHRLRWMYDVHHFQIHWKFYIGTVLIPLFTSTGVLLSIGIENISHWINSLIDK